MIEHKGPVYTTEGELLTNSDIAKDNVSKNISWFEGTKDTFEAALEAKCKKLDEPYAAMGFDDNIHMYIYQVGMDVFGLAIDPLGLSYRQVGVIG